MTSTKSLAGTLANINYYKSLIERNQQQLNEYMARLQECLEELDETARQTTSK